MKRLPLKTLRENRASDDLMTCTGQDLFRAFWRRPPRLNSAGFTLVELITVAAILGVLAILAISTFNHLVTRATIAAAVSDIRTLENDITAYIAENGNYPNSLNDINRGDLRDPWNQPYQYQNLALGGPERQDRFLNPLNTDFDLFSLGPDGVSAQSLGDPTSEDDVVRANDSGYIGLGLNF